MGGMVHEQRIITAASTLSRAEQNRRWLLARTRYRRTGWRVQTALWSHVADVVVSTFAGSGEVGLVDGIGTNATLSDPRGMVLDPANNRIVFADGNAIRAISIATGGVSTVVGSSEKGCSSGRCKVAKLSHPMDVAIDPTDGTVVVIDDNHIWRIDEKTDSVHAIAASENRDVKSTWLRAQPWGLCCDAKGNVIVADHLINYIIN